MSEVNCASDTVRHTLGFTKMSHNSTSEGNASNVQALNATDSGERDQDQDPKTTPQERSVAHVDDQLIYQISAFHPVYDPATKATTISMSGTSLIHSSSVRVASQILDSFPSILGDKKAPTRRANSVTIKIPPSSSLVFFVDKVNMSNTGRTTASGTSGFRSKTMNFSFLLLFSTTSPTSITFRTVTRAEAANITSPEQLAEVNRAMAEAKTHLAAVTATEATNLAGSITLDPQLHNCTQATLSASMTLQAEAIRGIRGGISRNTVRGVSRNKVEAANNVDVSVTRGASKVGEKETPRNTLSGGTSILNHLMTAISNLHTRFSRYSQVDDAILQHFITDVMPNSPPAQKHETEMIARILEHKGTAQTSSATITPWKRLPNTINESVAYYRNGGIAGKAVATIDTASDRAFAWLWNVHTYERVNQFLESEIGAEYFRAVDYIPYSRSMLFSFVSSFHKPLNDRIAAMWFTWHRESDTSVLLAFAPMDDHPPFHTSVKKMNSKISSNVLASKATKTSAEGFWRIQTVAPNVCKITLVMEVKLGGQIPQVLVNFRMKQNLDLAKKLQNRFLRKGKIVDAETRSAFPYPPCLKDLTNEQRGFVENCRVFLLGDHSDGTSWTTVQSPFVFVEMWSRRQLSKEGVASRLTGKAKTVVDTSAYLTVAWFFTFMSRERTRISSEFENPARLIVKETSPHDIVGATIKKMPFPLKNREFVARQLTAWDEKAAEFLFAVQSVDDFVDYGASFKMVRGKTTILARIIPVSKTQCEVVYFQYIDAGGRLPVRVFESQLARSLSVLNEARDTFQRDEAIDKEEREELARVIRDEEQLYTPEESDLIDLLKRRLAAVDKGVYERLKSPDFFVEMKWNFKEEGGVGKATVVVDASIEDCAAWNLCPMSRMERKALPALDRRLSIVNSHCSIFYLALDLMIPGLNPRAWVMRQIWKWDGHSKDRLEIFAENFEDPENYPINPGYVLAKSFPHFEYEKLEPIGVIPQTRVTFTQGLDLGGIIPKRVVSTSGVSRLMVMSQLRKFFDKSLEIDKANRERIIEKIMSDKDSYSDTEKKIIRERLDDFKLFDDEKFKNVDLGVPTTTAKIAFKYGDPIAWGWASTTVRATPEQILAFSWDTLGRNKRRGDDLCKALVEVLNDHNQLLYQKKATPRIISDRDFLGRLIWMKSETGYVLVTHPEDNHKRPPLHGTVRAYFPSAMKIKRLSITDSEIEFIIHPNFDGSKTEGFLTNFYTARNLKKVTEIQQYFQSLRGLEHFDAGDGKALGELMVIKTKAEKLREKHETKFDARLRELFKKYKGLKEINAKYEFFQAMMAKVVQNNLRPASDVNTRLFCVSLKEGRTIGAGLASSLVSSLTAEAAVDEWIGKYPALQDLDTTEAWFRPMMDIVALRLLGNVSWGLKVRVFLSAGLSMLDMASDINVIILYWAKDEEKHYAIMLLCMLTACMICNLLIVRWQNKEPRKMFKEVLITLLGLKPALDAFKVASGAEIEEGNTVEPKVELTTTKCMEIFFESIPGCILQSYVLLKSRDKSVRAVASIIISAATTGVATATICYDYDVDPVKRKETPHFYGFIPDGSSRSAIFTCMAFNSSLLLLARSFSAALLMLKDKRYFIWYSACDMGVYFFQKIVRSDFDYWMPFEGGSGIVLSFFARFVCKIITDYTGIVQLRAPAELGGIYWSINMFIAILSPIAVTILAGEDLVFVKERTVWFIVVTMSSAWLLFFALFLSQMKKEYRKTFFSLETGSDWAMSFFLAGDTDAKRSKTLRLNKKKWHKIRPEVKEWVLKNFEGWEIEKPEWFNDAWISRLPDDMLPGSKLNELKMKGGGARRRSSLGDILGGDKRKVGAIG